MWNLVVLVAMMSITGVYAMLDTESQGTRKEANAMMLADSMATYREAVTLYFSSYPAAPQSVDIETLKAANVLPQWSTLYTQPDTSIWGNYMDAAGLIYVYAASVPAPDTITHVLKLSHNSVLAGVFRTGDTMLYSPVFGNTNISLPSPADVSIPNGSPVWIAMRR